MKKVDSGFEFIYWRLSYRRKFIRTLWSIPFCAAMLILVWLISDNILMNKVETILVFFILVIQLRYNYIKWKKEEKNTSGN